MDYEDGSFSYQLPVTINLKKSEKQLGNEIINKASDKLETTNINIYENGLIEGRDFKTYEDALDAFMETLPKLRRNI
jgi:uncharacterized protein